MIYSLEQRQQQKQKLTQEQQFFMEMLKMNKEELAGYLEEEFQNNPLLDFDRRTFWKDESIRGTGISSRALAQTNWTFNRKGSFANC